MALTSQEMVNQALARISAEGGLFCQPNPLGAAGGILGGVSEYQKLVEQAKQQVRPNPLSVGFLGCLTRFDPSTNTRVPVTQEWVDEAVAEIVRLNIELSTKAEPMPGTDMLKVDHIWEAVRAASAV